MIRIADFVEKEEERVLGKMFVMRTLLLAGMKIMQTVPHRGCQQFKFRLTSIDLFLFYCPLYFDIVFFWSFFAFSVADCTLYCGPVLHCTFSTI